MCKEAFKRCSQCILWIALVIMGLILDCGPNIWFPIQSPKSFQFSSVLVLTCKQIRCFSTSEEYLIYLNDTALNIGVLPTKANAWVSDIVQEPSCVCKSKWLKETIPAAWEPWESLPPTQKVRRKALLGRDIITASLENEGWKPPLSRRNQVKHWKSPLPALGWDEEKPKIPSSNEKEKIMHHCQILW